MLLQSHFVIATLAALGASPDRAPAELRGAAIFQAAAGKSGKARKEQCNYFMKYTKSLGRGLRDRTMLAFSRTTDSSVCPQLS